MTRTQPGASAVRLSPQQLAQLLAAVACGDAAAFEQLYAATSTKLYGIVFRLVGRRDLAEEVLQDAYLRIWQHAARFDPNRGSPITWMAAIARNRALDETSRAACRTMSDDTELLELTCEDDPLAHCERTEDARRLYACLARLGSERREIIVQAYCLGMSRQEIAKKTGLPVSTVKTWLRRSLAQLKTYLEAVERPTDSSHLVKPRALRRAAEIEDNECERDMRRQ